MGRPYGQHFLHDANILKRALELSGVTPGDRVLEIGPGEGALTALLLEAGASVLAVEIDTRLIGPLRARFGSHPQFELLVGDALAGKHALNPDLVSQLKSWGDYKLVSNLPYGAGTPLLINLWQSSVRPQSALVMVQKEVGDRLAASVGSPDYGALSVQIANVATARVEMKVSAGCFNPPPKVDSCLVSFVAHDHPYVDPAPLAELMRVAFAQRRKTVKRLEKQGWMLEKAEIDPELRPERVSPQQWWALAASTDLDTPPT